MFSFLEHCFKVFMV